VLSTYDPRRCPPATRRRGATTRRLLACARHGGGPPACRGRRRGCRRSMRPAAPSATCGSASR